MRSCNVIITGLQPLSGVHDADVFEEFCEINLTVKPRPIRSSSWSASRWTASKIKADAR